MQVGEVKRTDLLGPFAPPALGLRLDQTSSLSVWRQLYLQMRDAVIEGKWPPGMRMPAARTIAAQLSCSNAAVSEAVAQLSQEGFLVKTGGLARVTELVAEEAIIAARTEPAVSRRATDLSRRGATLSPNNPPDSEPYRAFAPSLPDISLFPFQVWHKLARVWRNPCSSLLLQSDAGGYWPLRETICAYLRASRMIECNPEDVLITTGAQNGVDVTARLLLDIGDEAWVEDPGYPGLRSALYAAGANIVPVPIDEEGMMISAGIASGTTPRLIAVAPSHQYPLGTVMSLRRRMDLLAFAKKSDSWIIEDDYDNEFRYAGRPLAALRSLDDSRVIYVGTFSKVLFPSLRLGYIVVPPKLAARMAAARMGLDIQPSILAQPVVDMFMREGFFLSHVRKMRAIYRKRQAALVQAVEIHLSDVLDVQPDATGIHLLARFTNKTIARLSDAEASRRAASHGVIAPALSDYYCDKRNGGGLVLGYAAVNEKSISSAAERLAVALRD
jgi:GntR family transcriptional regulator/MocR family aminotransferase